MNREKEIPGEGTARAKALRWEQAWYVWEAERKP